jgi:hypothetical protein
LEAAHELPQLDAFQHGGPVRRPLTAPPRIRPVATRQYRKG